MSNPSKILTLHPNGKKGVNIYTSKYESIKAYLIKTIKAQNEITYQALNQKAIKELSKTFDGKVGWYVVTVKLDLEARGIIERIPKISPHKVRMK